MEQAEYKQLVASLEGLTDDQFEALLETLRQRKDADGVQRLVQARMAERRCCPHCESMKVVKDGVAYGSQRFFCKDCRKTFNALTGTPFSRLRGKEKLLENAACMADGLSIRKTAARLGITVDKAFRWRHKFLEFLNVQKPSALSGIVEADETFFPVSYKGQKKGLPRTAKKRAGKTKDGAGTEKTAVVVAVQRGTQVEFDHVLPNATAVALTDALRPVMGSDAILSTDGNAAYWTVAKELEVKAGYFISSYHGKGGNGTWHVQSVNRYDAHLKGWMARFKGVATKYLANYLGWRRLLDRFKDNLTPQQFLFHALRPSYQ
ncbi:IS1595 family transposase [Acidithiobacillus sp. MC6.1]|nr:IS1595 family transposase [Acidithiobacillus sp. MC6.1]